jgi:hypothetical protein
MNTNKQQSDKMKQIGFVLRLPQGMGLFINTYIIEAYVNSGLIELASFSLTPQQCWGLTEIGFVFASEKRSKPPKVP